MSAKKTAELVAERARQLSVWLSDVAPYAEFDQYHLEAGSPEQAYWHLGYRAALNDILEQLGKEAGSKPKSPRGSSEPKR